MTKGSALAIALFVGFATLAGASMIAGRVHAAPVTRQRITNALLAWGIAASFMAGLRPMELWPFATWALMPSTLSSAVVIRGLVAVDSVGGEHRVDHRAWAPLSEEELLSWLDGPSIRADSAQQRRALEELLTRAESARRRALLGESVSPHPSRLGAAAASTHLLHPDRWRDLSSVPPHPLVALRFVEDRWDVVRRQQGDTSKARRVLYEWSQGRR